MIGIGVTTRNRTNILSITLENISKFLPANCLVVVCDDTEDEEIKAANKMVAEKFGFEYKHDGTRKGVARNKNLCLSSLKDCDYIFLFDDDCYPLKEGWAEYIIRCHKESGVHHFNLLDKTLHEHTSTKKYDNFAVDEFRNVGGVFMFVTKEVVEKVGAFNKDYDVYGFEHASYTYRVYKSGLHNGHGINLTISDLQNYLFSFDYARFASNVNHNIYINSNYDNIFIRSINQKETNESINKNRSIMAQDVNGPVFREL
jgi:GT2 family glycosyltransferase